jgi:hypothetical protein
MERMKETAPAEAIGWPLLGDREGKMEIPGRLSDLWWYKIPVSSIPVACWLSQTQSPVTGTDSLVRFLYQTSLGVDLFANAAVVLADVVKCRP